MGEIAKLILEKILGLDSAAEALGSLGEERSRVFLRSEALVPVFAAATFKIHSCPVLLVVPQETERAWESVRYLLGGEAFRLPGEFSDGGLVNPCDEDTGARFTASRALKSGAVVVTGPDGFAQGPPPEIPEPWPLRISEGAEINPGRLAGTLLEGGYRREFTVEGWGQFAVRGGILDVFPSSSARPVRIEFLGDTVETIREFNVVTQRSSERTSEVEIFPAVETELVRRPSWESFGGKVIAVNRGLIECKVGEILDPGEAEVDGRSLFDGLKFLCEVEVSMPGAGARRGKGAVFPGEPVHDFRGNVNRALSEWKRRVSKGEEIFLVLSSRGQMDRAGELWDEEGAGLPRLRMEEGTLARGFSIPEAGFAVFTSEDILGSRKFRRRTWKASSGARITSYEELEKGSYVVHIEQGIGIFRGLVSRKVLGVRREYLLIEYAMGDRLYVPTSQLSRVQRYVGAENPRVNRLKSREWSGARKRAKKHAEKAARELFKLYLERKTRKGHAFPPDGPWQRELEDSFEYEETPDQERAVLEVKADMEKETPMDRLVCGDVGYGKTEVAIRAAMKAVTDSKQVAVLVPTTVLASQHLETFRNRLAPFPVRVEMLSRFLSMAEQERIARRVSRGEVDVVIGTHRLLQEDVAFRNLGLLIIDEEHKFGVSQKEKIKLMSRTVDTLTLSATPIPRTLQMSLSGIRDISIIDTPPEDRHPVSTYVGEFDMDLVKRAVRYEVSRGGQVFYLHNRVGTISRVEERLRKALPDVSIAVAHGQMREDDLEMVMWEFAEGSYDLLLCTTIIESGLDLPNVNTLIVEGAEKFGLAQLYQIRGRVGRSSRRAYAYFFYPKRAMLTDAAVQRLSTISEMASLGSGTKVAMRDLEIRGAGNVLGLEQSGHVEAVGFELYCELLREAVEALKGERRIAPRYVSVELPVDAYIPEDYVSDEEARVDLYRRLSTAAGIGEIDWIRDEMRDRFGEPPLEVLNLLGMEKARVAAASVGVESITMSGSEIHIKFFKDAAEHAGAIRGFVGSRGEPDMDFAHYDPKQRTACIDLTDGKSRDGEYLLRVVREVLGALRKASRQLESVSRLNG